MVKYLRHVYTSVDKISARLLDVGDDEIQILKRARCCLRDSFSDGAAITINADEVILDLNGTSLHGPGGSNSAIGVLVPSRRGVTIQNGDIDGFGLAAYSSSSGR